MEPPDPDPNFNDIDLRAVLPRDFPERVDPEFWALCYVGDPEVMKTANMALGEAAAWGAMRKWVQKREPATPSGSRSNSPFGSPSSSPDVRLRFPFRKGSGEMRSPLKDVERVSGAKAPPPGDKSRLKRQRGPSTMKTESPTKIQRKDSGSSSITGKGLPVGETAFPSERREVPSTVESTSSTTEQMGSSIKAESPVKKPETPNQSPNTMQTESPARNPETPHQSPKDFVKDNWRDKYRSEKAKSDCAERDGKRCIITGVASTTIERAHIYPVSLITHKTNGNYSFWGLLKCFWSEEQILLWQSEVFPQGLNHLPSKDSCRNMICLNTSMHKLWTCGAFALKPIEMSEDERELTLQFFWQNRPISRKPKVDLFTKPVSKERIDADFEGSHWFYQNGQKIKSGDTITMTTTDPVRLPLPSFHLMQLQWCLQRVLGMSAAAAEEAVDEVVRDAFDDDASDDAGWADEEIFDDDVSEYELGESF